jgi:hypothetical protein
MMSAARTGARVLTVLAILAPRFVGAQETAPPDVRTGQTVRAVMNDGARLVGTVRTISSSMLEIQVNERPISIALDTVDRIHNRDSLLNGAIIGAVPVAIFFALAENINESLSQCLFAPDPCSYDSAKATLKGLAIGAGIGGAIGALIDAMRERVVFRSRPKRSAVSLSPAISLDSAGLSVHLRW